MLGVGSTMVSNTCLVPGNFFVFCDLVFVIWVLRFSTYFCFMQVLVLSNVWVEPASSAAGRRMVQLLQIFRNQDWRVCYASTAAASDHAVNLTAMRIETATIAMNDDGFNAFAKAKQPNIVLFDRFMVEEQFGWRIAQECPTALRILDTEDLHCLRKGRQLAIKENRNFQEIDLVSDTAKREIASIYRCDLSLVISQYEMQLLLGFFKVSATLLHYVPFLEEPSQAQLKPFKAREHFVSIGNFLHAPNWDATVQLKQEIWPLIRAQLPQAQLDIYGAYPSQKVTQLHNPVEGFLVKGRAESAQDVIENARVLLAPLRYGAGLKGKFIDAMRCGTPSVTTPIGAEAMTLHNEWSGSLANHPEAFANAAVQLYSQEVLWQAAQEKGEEILKTLFQKSDFEQPLLDCICTLIDTLESHRAANFTGQMLHHHTLQSTKYMSKWIEEKNGQK